jgi:hypothetical protein
MSGTPKYSTVTIRDDVARQLARQAREIERNRREVVEQRAQAEREKRFNT